MPYSRTLPFITCMVDWLQPMSSLVKLTGPFKTACQTVKHGNVEQVA